MQDIRADNEHWCAKVREAGPGYRVWRWEEYLDRMPFLVFRYRLLEPGEPEPDEPGSVIGCP